MSTYSTKEAVERRTGFEPIPSAWKAESSPRRNAAFGVRDWTRTSIRRICNPFRNHSGHTHIFGGRSRNRTWRGFPRRIYSPLQHLVAYRPFWHRWKESNPHLQFWRLTCCHYTTPILFA